MALNNDRRNRIDEKESRTYEKELTIEVDIQGEDRVTMMELLKKVKEECGIVIACRFKTPKKYELTMQDAGGRDKMMDGIKIRNNIIVSKELSKNELMVSFMSLPAYITDGEIMDKLAAWGVSAVSPIKRRVWPGTDIVEGTRFVKVQFPKDVQSLPYSTRFETLQGMEYFRVIHDKQVKVCRLCIQPGHIIRDCPEFSCFKCHQQGHYARECENGREESEEFFSDPEKDEEEEEEEEGDTTPAEAGEASPPAAAEEAPPAAAEEAPPAETEVVEETPSAERAEVEVASDQQHVARRDGEELQVCQDTVVAHQVSGDAAIGDSMDGVAEEIDSSLEGKIGRVAGVGPSAGPAPPPSDHVSTSRGEPPGKGEPPRSGRGRAEKVRSGVRTRGGSSSGPASGTARERRRREPAQEGQHVPPSTLELDAIFSGDDMDSSPEAINLKRKAGEERRANEKNAKK